MIRREPVLHDIRFDHPPSPGGPRHDVIDVDPRPRIGGRRLDERDQPLLGEELHHVGADAAVHVARENTHGPILREDPIEVRSLDNTIGGFASLVEVRAREPDDVVSAADRDLGGERGARLAIGRVRQAVALGAEDGPSRQHADAVLTAVEVDGFAEGRVQAGKAAQLPELFHPAGPLRALIDFLQGDQVRPQAGNDRSQAPEVDHTVHALAVVDVIGRDAERVYGVGCGARLSPDHCRSDTETEGEQQPQHGILPPLIVLQLGGALTVPYGRARVPDRRMTHLTTTQIESGLADAGSSPRDRGTLELIVRRPAVGAREELDEGALDVAEGLVGDTWSVRGSRRSPDGGPHPDMQLNVMNARVAALLAGTRERWVLAGDQLFVDLDLSEDNLPAGTRLSVGTAVIEVTAEPHTGCGKFVERFGADAMAFVNSARGRRLRLRGLNARVVRGGSIRRGDVVAKADGAA